MVKKTTSDKINQTIARGIAVSASTAVAHASQHKQPLVVWRDGKIKEVNATSALRTAKERKLPK